MKTATRQPASDFRRGLHSATPLLVFACSALNVAALRAQSDSTRLEELPAPTGSFRVGRASLHWVDSTRADSSGRGRELMVYLWYPAEERSGNQGSAYIPDLGRIHSAIGDSGMDQEFGKARAVIQRGGPATHSIDSPAISTERPSFPLLLFSHGFGESGLTYAAMLEDLASHGYIVAGVEHPGDAYAVALPDGRVILFNDAAWQAALGQPKGPTDYQLAQIPPRALDLRFVLDRLLHRGRVLSPIAGRIDGRRIGVFGHSLGGLAAARVCRMDRRVRACMNQDAEYRGMPFLAEDAGLTQPFLFVASDHSLYLRPNAPQPSDAELLKSGMTRASYDSLMRSYALSQTRSLEALRGGAWRVALETPGFRHRSFIDLTLLSAADPTRADEARRNLGLIREFTLAFFDWTLKGRRGAALDREPAAEGVTVTRFPR